MDASQNQSQQAIEEGLRIINLHELIAKNIELDDNVEKNECTKTFLKVDRIMSKANEITKGSNERRTNTTELVLDTELLRRNHEVACKAIDYNISIADRTICQAISDVIHKDGEENWDSLCALGLPFMTPHFTNDSMLPFIDVSIKEYFPKQRTKRQSKVLAEEKRPVISDKLERKDDGSVSVSHLLKQIKQIYQAGGNKSIPYFKLIINPDNFMDTVQNALHLSFLIREQCVSIKNGEDGLPVVDVVAKPKAPGQEEPAQAICSIDVAYCEKMAQHYKIHEPMLKKLGEP
ncbi:hypothetical protein KR018_006957 [Drosophila ironensis]|nr:hypothetical protein KR018_006957 [Drosophila ironensis]